MLNRYARNAACAIVGFLTLAAFAACGPSNVSPGTGGAAAFPCNKTTQCPQDQICNIDKAVCIEVAACDGCMEQGNPTLCLDGKKTNTCGIGGAMCVFCGDECAASADCSTGVCKTAPQPDGAACSNGVCMAGKCHVTCLSAETACSATSLPCCPGGVCMSGMCQFGCTAASGDPCDPTATAGATCCDTGLTCNSANQCS